MGRQSSIALPNAWEKAVQLFTAHFGVRTARTKKHSLVLPKNSFPILSVQRSTEEAKPQCASKPELKDIPHGNLQMVHVSRARFHLSGFRKKLTARYPPKSFFVALLTTTNQIFSAVTVFSQLAIVGLLVVWFLRDKNTTAALVLRFLQRHGLLIAFFIAASVTIGSLFYSEVIGFEPCKLCWFQRILMFPQVLILGLALIKKDRHIGDYSILLSAAGALIAGFHYYVQITGSSLAPCSATGASCAQRYVFGYDYISIPMMSLTAFLLLIVLMGLQKTHSNRD